MLSGQRIPGVWPASLSLPCFHTMLWEPSHPAAPPRFPALQQRLENKEPNVQAELSPNAISLTDLPLR